jgi:hypothetical protein
MSIISLLLQQKYNFILTDPVLYVPNVCLALFAVIQVAVLAETTSFTSDNMRALTNKFNQQFVVKYYGALNSECIDTRQIVADCKRT